MVWTHREMEQLRALWLEGVAAAEIGRRLGCSKNSVVGKAHRMGLPGRPSPLNAAARIEGARERRAENRDAATALRAEGYTWDQVARRLGINARTAGRLVPGGAAPVPGRRGDALPVGAALPEAAPALRRPIAPPPPRAPVAAHPLMRAGANGCRFPIGEPRMPGFRYCEAPAKAGKPYCPACCERAYTRCAA